MSKRYYYTDPLAAAWMAKYFGVGFKSDNLLDAHSCYSSGITVGGVMSSVGCVQVLCTDRGKYRFYIHPDSLSILEPMVGDMMLCLGYGGDKDIGLVVEDKADMGLCDGKIIQRNGVAFMWPESEEA